MVLGKDNKKRLTYVPGWATVTVLGRPGLGGSTRTAFPAHPPARCGDGESDPRPAVYHVPQVRQRQAGIEKCAPHDLRSTFATAMLDNGEDLIAVKDAMGHASITTTQKYYLRGEEKLRRARDNFYLMKSLECLLSVL